MTIRRGSEWGVAVSRPAGLVVLSSDRALAAEVGATDPPAPLGVADGDLFRSLGAPPERATVQRVPIDVLHVIADGVGHRVVAHAVVRNSWWRGPIVAVMNVDHLGDWNVAPRAHPNDGRFDVVEVDGAMRLRERWQARSRLPQGTHVPHPAITVRTATSASWGFDRPLGLWLDGERVGSVGNLEVRIEPDAVEVHV